MLRITRLVSTLLTTLMLLGTLHTQAQRRVITQQEPTAVAPANNPWAAASNKANPFDEVGLQHNQLLAEFVRSREFAEFVRSGRRDDALVIKWLKDYCCRGLALCCIKTPGPYDPSPETLARIVRTSKTPSAMLDQLKVSAPVRAYARRIEAAVRELTSRGRGGPNYQPFFALESQIARDRMLSEPDRKKLLMMAATARYSTAYWRQVADDPASPWVSGGGARRKIDWGEVGFVDGIGGLFGAIFGAVASCIDVALQMGAE